MYDYTHISVSSIITFKDYLNTFVRSSNIQFSDDWGWFIDIESNSKNQYIYFPSNNQFSKQNYKQNSKYTYVPKTIHEIPSIRSFDSMNNLHEEIVNLKKSNSHKYMEYILHSVGILGLIVVFYGCKFL